MSESNGPYYHQSVKETKERGYIHTVSSVFIYLFAASSGSHVGEKRRGRTAAGSSSSSGFSGGCAGKRERDRARVLFVCTNWIEKFPDRAFFRWIFRHFEHRFFPIHFRIKLGSYSTPRLPACLLVDFLLPSVAVSSFLLSRLCVKRV